MYILVLNKERTEVETSDTILTLTNNTQIRDKALTDKSSTINKQQEHVKVKTHGVIDGISFISPSKLVNSTQIWHNHGSTNPRPKFAKAHTSPLYQFLGLLRKYYRHKVITL